MPLKPESVKKILVISLSNIGDCILTFPVIDILKRDFPEASLSIVVGQKPATLFAGNPHIQKVFIFHKSDSPFQKMKWVLSLRKEKFDLIVDLRNTAIAVFLWPARSTPWTSVKNDNIHMRQKHLNRLKDVFDYAAPSPTRFAIHITDEHRSAVQKLLGPQISPADRLIVVAPGAANHLKQWTINGFAEVSDHLIEEGRGKIVFVGDGHDKATVAQVLKGMSQSALDLSGELSLLELAALLQRASLLLANDSGAMHLSSYLNTPIVAIFGPTDSKLYGPWSTKNFLVQSDTLCVACQNKKNEPGHTCLEKIPAESVLKAARQALT